MPRRKLQGKGRPADHALGSEGLARSVPALARPISNRMYQSALKPPPSLGAAGARPLVETGLQEGVPVSEGGLAKLGNLREATDQAIADTIAKAPTKTINKYAVAKRLGGTEKTFSNQVNPTSDLEAIRQSKGEFLRSQPGEIPSSEAQALKQGTYRSLGKKYGELKGASIESQKALARGLKEELANQYPELKALNTKDSRLIQLDNALERAVARSVIGSPLVWVVRLLMA